MENFNKEKIQEDIKKLSEHQKNVFDRILILLKNHAPHVTSISDAEVLAITVLQHVEDYKKCLSQYQTLRAINN